MNEVFVDQQPSTSFHVDLFEILDHHSTARPDDIAFESISADGRDTYSWRRFRKEVDALSRALHQLGARPDDHAGILIENHPRWCIAFMAVQSVGAVAVLLDTISAADSIKSVVEHAEARFIVASPRFYSTACGIAADHPSNLPVFGAEREWSHIEGDCSDCKLPHVQRSMDDNLAILYTGGTTGRPKGVLLTQRSIYRSVVDMMAVFPLSPADRILSILPMFHIMPLLSNLIAPLYTGARVVFLAQLDPAKITDAFADEGVTAFLCVPLFYYQVQRRILEEVARQPALKRWLFRTLLQASGFLRHRFGLYIGKRLFPSVHARFGSRLRAFGIGGAGFNPDTARFFADLGFKLFQAYGMTECSGLATVTPLGRSGGLTCGKPAAHVEVCILNQDSSGIGEVLVRGENVMQGYFRDPDATKAAIQEGWLHTGDLGMFTSDGSLRVTGRIKEVIVLSSGKNIFPEEIEEVFINHCKFIQDVCIVGIESSEGARLHCLVVPNMAAFRDRQISSIEHHIRSEVESIARQLPPYKRPSGLQIVNVPLPRTSTRKLQRFKAAQMVRESAPPPALDHLETAFESDDPIERKTVSLIRGLDRNATRITPSTNLELDLGLDSLQRVELAANVERVFGVVIATEQVSAFFKVGDIINFIKANPGDKSLSDENWRDWKSILMQPLTDDERKFVEHYLKPRAAIEFFWFVVFRSIRVAARLLLRLRVDQADLLPSGGFLLCPNHLSYLDDILMPASLPLKVFRRTLFLGASKYFENRLLAALGRALRVIPVDSDANLVQALRIGCEGVRAGMVLCVFPEGTRSFDGGLQKLMKGPAVIAQALAAPIVPVGIKGTFEVLPRTSGFGGFHPVGISIGKPMFVSQSESVLAFNERLSLQIKTQANRAAEIVA